MAVTYETYYCDSETLKGLRQVCTRLYADKPLVGDERRDLANRMEALLGHIEELPVKDERQEFFDRSSLTVGTLFAKIAQIAEPVVKYYTADIGIHDRGTLASLQPGDTALWACRESGSHLAFLDLSADREMSVLYRREAMLANRNLFRACNEHWPGMQWFLLTVTDHDGHGTVTRVSVKKAERLFAERLGSMSQVSSSPRD